MNRQIRIGNECKQWNVDEEFVEIIHGRRRIFIARVDLYENFDKKTADAHKAMDERLNRRRFQVLYTTRDADAAKVAENYPKIVVSALYCGKDVEIMKEFGADIDILGIRTGIRGMRIGWASKGLRHVIRCQEGPVVTIEQADETLTHATLTWHFNAY